MTPAPRMSCDEVEVLLQPYLDGEFDAGERVEVERHLENCQACARHMATEASFREALRRTAATADRQTPAPARLRMAVGAKIAEVDRRARFAQLSRLSAAAVLLLTAGGGYFALRPSPERPYVDNAALWHARQLPTEIAGDDPARVERWFGGKLDHRVPVPRFANMKVEGARLSLVKDRPAAYITYVANPAGDSRRLGLFVFSDSDNAVRAQALPAVELARSHGYNVAQWREGEIVYQLVSDLDEADIRQMLAAKDAPPTHYAGRQPVARELADLEDHYPLSVEPPPASFAATLSPAAFERGFTLQPASLQR